MLDLHLHLWPHGPGTPTPTVESIQRYCEAAEALISCDVAIELSSAGLRKPVGSTYPAPTLSEALVAADLSVTTASDAHTVDLIGNRFDVLDDQLDRARVDTLATIRRRERTSMPR